MWHSNNDLLPFWHSQSFSSTFSAVALVPSEYPHGSQLWSSPWCLTPTPEPWQPAPISAGGRGTRVTFWVQSAVHNNLCSDFSPFCLLSTCCCSPLWGSKPPPWPGLWGDFWGCGNSSSFMTPFLGHKSLSWNPLSPFYLYLLPYLVLSRLTCLFGSLVSSASIQMLFCRSCSIFRWIFDESEGDLPVLDTHHLLHFHQIFRIFNN